MHQPPPLSPLPPLLLPRFGQGSITTQNNVKSSVYRGIKASIVEQYPPLEDYIDEILPKKVWMTFDVVAFSQLR